MIRARVKKKDPVAINLLGEKYYQGELGLQKDMQKGVPLWTQAAELGSVDALHHLGIAYHNGVGVQQDKGKAVQFWSKAAMKGHEESRHNLGLVELEKGNNDRALRQFLISARMGDEDSVGAIKELFKVGLATKEQYAEALRGYQHAVEETKSAQRDEAKALMKSRGGLHNI